MRNGVLERVDNALNDLNASLATNFEDLMCKFKLLSKEQV